MNKKYLFSISLLISLLIILIPIAVATELETYDKLVLKTKEEKINLYQNLGDDPYVTDRGQLSDPGQACVEQHKETSSFADSLDNSVISTLEKIASILLFICTVTTAIDKVVNTVSLAIGMISGDFCCPAAVTPPGAAACVSAAVSWKSWSIPFEFIKPLCCFVNCGWCTGEDCWGAILPIHLGKIGNLGFLGPGVGLAQMGISPFDNIYTAIGCLCPIAIIFNLRKLKTIYDAYDCCIQQACTNGLSTEACEKQLDEATCMYWEGSFYSILAKILISLLAAKIVGPIIKQLAQNALMDQFLACVYAAFKIVEGIKVVTSVTKMYNQYVGAAFEKPPCEDLKFKDVKEMILEDWEHVTLIDKDGDRVYDSTAKNYVKVPYNEIPANLQSSAKKDTTAKVYTIKDEKGDIKDYYEFKNTEGKKVMYDTTGKEIEGYWDRENIKTNSIPASESVQSFDDNSLWIRDSPYKEWYIEHGKFFATDSEGQETQPIDLEKNAANRAAFLKALNLDKYAAEMGDFEDTEDKTLKYEKGKIKIESNLNSKVYTITQEDKTTTITNYNDGSTLTQLPDKKWEFQVDGRKVSGTTEIPDTEVARKALSHVSSDLGKAKDVTPTDDGVTYNIGDKKVTVDATISNQVTKTESWQYKAEGIDQRRQITTTTNIETETATVDLKKGTTQIATGLDPSLIGGVENIDWDSSDNKKLAFTDTKIPLLGITLDKSYVTQDPYGTYKIFEEWDSDNNVGLHPTAYISIDQATGARIVEQMEGMRLGKEQYTVISIIKDGKKIDINPDLFEANQPFRGLEGEELVKAAEAYNELGRPDDFKIIEGEEVIFYNNGKTYGEPGYKDISYSYDGTKRLEETFSEGGNYGKSTTNLGTGRVDNFRLGNSDQKTEMTFERITTEDGEEVFAAKTKINGYNIVFEDGELKAITPDGKNKYSLEQITDKTPSDVEQIAKNANVKIAIANKEAAKEIIKKDQEAKKKQEEKEKKAAEKRRTEAEKIAQSKEIWDAKSIATYQLAWEFLYAILKTFVDNFIEDKCKEDYEASYPPQDTPSESGGPAACEDTENNVYNAQFISKTGSGDTKCQYTVSYALAACNHEIDFVVQLQGTGSNKNIEGGTLAQGKSISRKRIMTSNLCTHQRICIIIKGEEITECFPPK